MNYIRSRLMSKITDVKWDADDNGQFQLDLQPIIDDIKKNVDREVFRQLLLEELRNAGSPVTQAIREIINE